MRCLQAIFLLLTIIVTINSTEIQNPSRKDVCRPVDFFHEYGQNTENDNLEENGTVFIMYDVNPSEGFNLRRDVYIRMAVFVKHLKKILPKFKNAKLVLPPFRRLYHWKSSNLQQNYLFWNHFFDLDSLKKFTDVIDMFEFFTELKNFGYINDLVKIDYVYKLTNFEEMFENGIFRDKYEFWECSREDYYPEGFYLQYRNLTGNKFSCLRFQGGSNLLREIMDITSKRIGQKSPQMVLYLNAEIILHEHWGNAEFWRARRSMRFNSNLVRIANKYRLEKLNSTDEKEKVQRPADWRDEQRYRKAKGGDYLCAHLRRADFLYGREKVIPTLRSTANQIRAKLKELKLTKLFISSDCNKFEYKNLKSYLGGGINIYRFEPESLEQKAEIKDGGIAIVDQIICSHARYFLGTYESTFTYRIYEEREILGFPQKTTFNTICKNEDLTDCQNNSIWPIEY